MEVEKDIESRMVDCGTCIYEDVCVMPDFVRNDLKKCKVYKQKPDYKKIIITDKERVYIFQVELLLKPEHLQEIRTSLQKQITEGCVLLPGYIRLLNEEQTPDTIKD